MKRSLVTLGVIVALAGCDSDNHNVVTSDFTLQLLHVADMDGSNATVLENASNMSALVEGFTSQHANNTLFLSSGDNYIPGSRYDAAADESMVNVDTIGVPGVARADIAMLNAMGLQASAVGNHDLDGGSAEFASIINTQSASSCDANISCSADYIGAQFPYLSANMDFATDENTIALVATAGQSAANLANKLTASTVITVDGEHIGIVGITTPTNDDITTVDDIAVYPLNDDIGELAAIVQSEVNALTATGINKIIALAHMQSITYEKQLAELLRDVDIIVAGGSNTLLANDDDRLWAGDTAAGSYPIIKQDADGNDVAIVNVDADYKYLGRLVVDFDSDGKLLVDSISAADSGPVITDGQMVDATEGATPNSDVIALVDSINEVLIESESNVVGHTDVFLNGTRSYVRTEETNLGNLSADANLWYAQLHDASVVISLKNGGGIRADIGYSAFPAGSTDPDDLTYYPPAAYPAAQKAEGDISQYDVQTALAFNNGLSVFDLTGEQLWDILESGVAGVENISGGFHHVAGLCFSYDGTKTARQSDPESGAVTVAGERVQQIIVDTDSDGNCDKNSDDMVMAGGTLQLPDATYRTVSLDYLASGAPYPCAGDDCDNQVQLGDEMTTDPQASNFAATGSEQDALAEFLQAFYADSDSAYNSSDSVDGGEADARVIRLDK
ncbi:bifunctional metallophosphatase/5'-nucleotidase [Ferrimonas lipolytica]|uniref:Bifunctional metallophosphatase/5'-nucleotidase n=1 Tax=Ferrimonas lipolytica TaxID=2724191 RepID=A0A6H1UBX4_9GAMM|nr:bifunctional metallophosphatase/5'-nucleotidase [Ferrimonas lipolytica]QIZ76149.1 bifunctional metallophosphatase/5'-nucleotidase [Ferrimonas lipolytica]